MERKKEAKGKKSLLIFLLIIVMVLIVCLPMIQNIFTKISIKNTKKETTVTKTLSHDELYHLERNQRELANKLISENKRKWLGEEILQGALDIGFNIDFMTDHPEYDLVKINFQIVKYSVNGKTIKFITRKGKIIQVHSKDGWKDK